MTESPARARAAAVVVAPAPTIELAAAPRSPRWHLAARVVAAGAGLGGVFAAVGIGGVAAIPIFAGGLFMLSRAAAGLTRVPRVALR
jgi:hypothetical protein